MLEELGRTSSQSEVFTRTHTKKKDQGQWDDKCAEDTNQLYEEEIKQLEIAGDHKRGRVYGHGKVPSRLKPPVYDSDDFSVASGPVDMREQVTLLNREFTQQAKEHKQEVQALRQHYATQIRCLQSPFDTQPAEFNQWKSIVSDAFASFMELKENTRGKGGSLKKKKARKEGSLRKKKPTHWSMKHQA
ncbi:hypothetical protein PIB30_090199 [Stylosanthes scabra]|uniref:Uncharacterized protein n=1 Tax=Stylosanthes scabra TaxID=79078 RepID=A0ABU6QTN0_9FABA|nr:hypothetical protein [Stylosanthes scabra]